MALKVLTWNVEKVTPRSWKNGPVILDRIEDHQPELVCLTEAHADFLRGHVITSQEGYGYPIHDGQRMVVLWSRQPWREVDRFGSGSLPPGLFVSGVTHTSLGDVTVIGVCIPWGFARTEGWRGADRRKLWEDHEDYLDALSAILGRGPTERLIVMGDFNQWIGKGTGNAPIRCRDKLHDVFAGRIRIATADVAFKGRKTIDHIALSDDLTAESLETISNLRDDGGKLSDHFGVAAEVTARSS